MENRLIPDDLPAGTRYTRIEVEPTPARGFAEHVTYLMAPGTTAHTSPDGALHLTAPDGHTAILAAGTWDAAHLTPGAPPATTPPTGPAPWEASL